MKLIFLLVFLIGTVHSWRNHSGIQLTAKPTQATGRGKSSIKIGKGFGLSKEIATTSMSSTVVEEYQYVTLPPIRNHRSSLNLTIGVVVPFKSFGTRDYIRSITNSINALKKKENEKLFRINFRIDMLGLTPSPIRKYFSLFLISFFIVHSNVILKIKFIRFLMRNRKF